MEVINKPISNISRYMTDIDTSCDGDNVIILTKYGKPTFALMPIAVFDELQRLAEEVELYRELLEAEADINAGKGLPLDDALIAYEKLKETRRAEYIDK